MDEASSHPPTGSVRLRSLRVGDIGWIVHRHGLIYAEEYGWDIAFEALVAEIAGQFAANFKPDREAALIADRDGAILGAAFVVEAGPALAKLRLVYVERGERGSGLGCRLVEAAMDFARTAGYTRMTLWTHDVLVPARRLYQRLGFVMTASEAHLSFGRDLVSEVWERDL